GSDELRPKSPRHISANGQLCGKDSQGCKARRSAGAAADQSRVRHQPQNREGARPHCAADAARHRGRGAGIALLCCWVAFDRGWHKADLPSRPLFVSASDWRTGSRGVLCFGPKHERHRAVKRRDFITLLGGAASAWPVAVRAQQAERMRLIGVLMGYAESDSDARAWYAAFREAFQKLGWTGGRNVQLDARWATPDDAGSMRRFAMERVALQPDVLLSSTTPTTTALLQQTRTISIVFALVADPIGSGFVASLAHPGGNVTGFTF